MQSVNKDVSNWNCYTILVETQNGWKTVWQFFLIKHILIIIPCNLTARYLAKKHENLYSHKNLNVIVYGIFIHNHHKQNNRDVLELVNG